MKEQTKLDTMHEELTALVDKEAGDDLARMRDLASEMRQRRIEGDGFAGTVPPVFKQAELERFMASAETLLRSTRKRLLDADAAYREKRANIVNAMTDELHRLDRDHDGRIAELRAIIGKIEAMREA
jgi:hypothetical protein